MMKNACKILIIEDDPDIANVIGMILEFKGYTVFVLKNADGLNEIISNHQVDVIIMDMLLSGANGTDICKQLKCEDFSAKIPVIMMSAHPDAATICIKAGADDFVPKPFDLDELLFKVKHFIGSKAISE